MVKLTLLWIKTFYFREKNAIGEKKFPKKSFFLEKKLIF